MQKYVVSNAANPTAVGIQSRRSVDLGHANSIAIQTKAIERKIHVSGRAYVPLTSNHRIVAAVIATSTSARNPGRAKGRAISPAGNNRNASAAQRIRMRWKSGNQRKLHRKTPAVGIIASRRTTKRSPSSQRTFRQSSRPFATTPAISATGGTRPQASSVPAWGIIREEKSAHFTVQQGRISAGHAFGGTSH